MWKLITVAVLVAIAAGCREKSDTTGAPVAATSGGATSTAVPASAQAGAAKTSTATSASPGDFADRTGELTNPDDITMVLLYYDLARLPVPVDKWVENHSKVTSAAPADRASRRDQVRAAITADAAGVKNIGQIRLTMNANLSEYDPSYSEFTVRALAPSSVVKWKAFDENVSLKFGNAQKAQTWSIRKEDAQPIRDRIQYVGSVEVNVVARITHVQPGPEGGEITANVIEYELRNTPSGTTVGRVRVGG
jgi:hypothetical protein